MLRTQVRRAGLLAPTADMQWTLAWGLTLELSGGGAVRLNEKLGACAAPCLSDCAGATASPTKCNASSFECLELAATLHEAAGGEGLKAGESLAEAHDAREQPSKGLTLELSGGEAVRLG